MIVLDLDMILADTKLVPFSAAIVALNMVRVRTEKKTELKLGCPIYWFTASERNMADLKAVGLPAVGKILTVKSVVAGLKDMVARVDEVAEHMGLKKLGAFRKPVRVFTDRQFSAIEKLGAMPIPAQYARGT